MLRLRAFPPGAVTPGDVKVTFVDEACGIINFDNRVDLLGLTIETPVSHGAYQIVFEVKQRGVPVVMRVSMSPCFPKRPLDVSTLSPLARERSLSPR